MNATLLDQRFGAASCRLRPIPCTVCQLHRQLHRQVHRQLRLLDVLDDLPRQCHVAIPRHDCSRGAAEPLVFRRLKLVSGENHVSPDTSAAASLDGGERVSR